jgi:hypothetical protein
MGMAVGEHFLLRYASRNTAALRCAIGEIGILEISALGYLELICSKSYLFQNISPTEERVFPLYFNYMLSKC